MCGRSFKTLEDTRIEMMDKQGICGRSFKILEDTRKK